MLIKSGDYPPLLHVQEVLKYSLYGVNILINIKGRLLCVDAT